MTAQRLVRGSKARIIACLCAIVFCVGIFLIYQNTLTQLDNVNQNYEMCIQQQESLSTQLQVIVDYKTRLEKSLQTEKAEHKQTRTELESRINDEKSRRDKTSMEANIRFQSLQQHYKLLQTKHDDLKDKSDKLQQEQLNEIQKLQSSVKQLQEQVKQSKIEKEKSLENLKTLYLQEKIDKEHLTEELKKSKTDYTNWESEINHLTKINHQLERELEKCKGKSGDYLKQIQEDTLAAPQHNTFFDNNIPTTTRKFSKQIKISEDVYQIQDENHKPLNVADSNVPQIDIPNKGDTFDQNANSNQNVVLQKPSSSPKSTTKSTMVSKGNLGNARPLLLPTITPSNKIKTKEDNKISGDFNLNSINVLPMPNMSLHKKLPPGVVPVPKQELQINEKIEEKNNNGIPEEINLALPNRYRNNIIESELANEIIKETKPESKPINIHNEPELNMGADMNQQDNAAMEVLDQPKNNLDDPLQLMDVNQGLETNDVKMEHALKEPVASLLENNKKKQHIDALRNNAENGAIRAPPGAMYENDYDKDGHKEDLQIEEADPEGEEDDDGDDYEGHIAARQREPAVRN